MPKEYLTPLSSCSCKEVLLILEDTHANLTHSLLFLHPSSTKLYLYLELVLIVQFNIIDTLLINI